MQSRLNAKALFALGLMTPHQYLISRWKSHNFYKQISICVCMRLRVKLLEIYTEGEQESAEESKAKRNVQFIAKALKPHTQRDEKS